MAVNLKKGEKISLLKTSTNYLSQVFMGLGWDASKKGFFSTLFGLNKEIDLDASCLMFDEECRLQDVVFYNHLYSQNGSVLHSGDNRTGAGDGDDEIIHVTLDLVPPEIKFLVFTVTSYEKQNFNQIANAYCRLVDPNNRKELVRFQISGGGKHTGMLMSILYRNIRNEWNFKAMGVPIQATNPLEIAPACVLLLTLENAAGLLNE